MWAGPRLGSLIWPAEAQKQNYEQLFSQFFVQQTQGSCDWIQIKKNLGTWKKEH